MLRNFMAYFYHSCTEHGGQGEISEATFNGPEESRAS
jgi:hypothetical protein